MPYSKTNSKKVRLGKSNQGESSLKYTISKSYGEKSISEEKAGHDTEGSADQHHHVEHHSCCNIHEYMS